MDNQLTIFCSYALADEALAQNFRAHLRILTFGPVNICYAYDIPPGANFAETRNELLQSARLILLLVSVDFINSHENYQQESQLAMERQNAGLARVVPIILRPVHWQETVFGQLSSLPSNGRAITAGWPSLDHAFFHIISELKQIISSLQLTAILAPIPPDRENPTERLTQLLQAFKQLHGEIVRSVTPSRPANFSLANAEVRYNQLYGDTLVFLATYLPETVTDIPNNFAETVYRKTKELLRRKSSFDIATVFVARTLIPYLAQTEKLGMQMNACIATLESYQQLYFTRSRT